MIDMGACYSRHECSENVCATDMFKFILFSEAMWTWILQEGEAAKSARQRPTHGRICPAGLGRGGVSGTAVGGMDGWGLWDMMLPRVGTETIIWDPYPLMMTDSCY